MTSINDDGGNEMMKVIAKKNKFVIKRDSGTLVKHVGKVMKFSSKEKAEDIMKAISDDNKFALLFE
jgi:hypothetical protein